MEAIVLAVFPLLVVVEMLLNFSNYCTPKRFPFCPFAEFLEKGLKILLMYKDPELQFMSGRINRNQGGCSAKHCRKQG